MESYKSNFTIELTTEEFESKFNSHSYEIINLVIGRFNEIFPSAKFHGANGSLEFTETGVKYFVELESDVSPLEMAEKQTEIYTQN